MSSYSGVTKSNYFRVTDENRFKSIIENTVLNNGRLLIFSKDINGQKYYGFGFEGIISDSSSFELFEYELRQILYPDDAIIIIEIGHEKLRHVEASSLIITKHDTDCVRLDYAAFEKAREMLNNKCCPPQE